MPSLRSLAGETLRLVLPLVILVVGIGGFLAIGSRSAPPRRPAADDAVPLVETAPVRQHAGGLIIETDGLVVPFREIVLAAEVAGRIVEKSPECEAGRYVTRGTLLVRIDPRDYELEIERLTSEVAQADADLTQLDVEEQNIAALLKLAEEEAALQQRQLDRILASRAGGAVTEAFVDEARRSELTARHSVQTQRNQLRMIDTRRARLRQSKALAETKLEQARLDLSRTEVRAPIDGVVSAESVEQDAYVQPGTALVTINDTAAVEVHCNLRMDELNWLWQQRGPPARPAESPGVNFQIPKTPATVLYRLGGREYAWQGELSRFEGIGLDEKTRTVPCRVLIPEPCAVSVDGSPGLAQCEGPRTLMRGMYVAVQLHAEPKATLLRLPERAIRPGNVVWCARDGKLDVRTVEVARVLDESVLVDARASGLAAGDRVIISPVAVATEGMPIREKTAE